MSRPSHVYVLAEDGRQRQFVYRLLLRAGVLGHQITFGVSPSGRGSAEQWVRENFARQVRSCRARNSRANTAMIAMVDADTQGVNERIRSLDGALTNNGQNQIDTNSDQIARLIPKRNVETWILCLTSEAVSEERDYKQTKSPEEWSSLIPPASETLFSWTRANVQLPASTIDSLRLGVQELNRVFAKGE